ncbi:MAG: N5-glutamine methyltransferase family protein [Bacteroidia bacterium]
MAFRSLSELRQELLPYTHPRETLLLWRRALETLTDNLPQTLAEGRVPWTPQTQIQWQKILTYLRKGIPWQYWAPLISFGDLDLLVSEGVFIPRPETEAWIWKLLPKLDRPERVFDIGTGTGCLALVAKRFFPDAQVWAVDISPSALTITARNAQTLKLALHLLKLDFLQAHEEINCPADLILSNPPYIPYTYAHTVDPLVYHNEPPEALFCKDIEFYEALFSFAEKNLTNKGILAMELFPPTATRVQNLCPFPAKILTDTHQKPRTLIATKYPSLLDNL